jgi:hypothetical protein
MRESHRKGVANHPEPESCVAGRKATIEALTGAHAGRVLSCEIIATRVPTSFRRAEGNTGGCAFASTRRTLRSLRPQACREAHAREPGDPSDARRGRCSGPVGAGLEPEVQHARRWGVGRSNTPGEVPEQR